MKTNLPIIDKEVSFAQDVQLISTTDLKGVITFVNDEFIKISGFSRDELIGQNHNIVRHPEMPPAAFKDLWTTIQSGQSWKGMVKNRCKDGRYYWVDAFVSPISKDGQIIGYQSVRTLPTDECKKRAQGVFQQWSKADKGAEVSFKSGLSIASLLNIALFIPAIITACILAYFFNWQSAAVAVAGFAASILGVTWVSSFIKSIVESAKIVAHNPAMSYIYSGMRNDLGLVLYALQVRTSELRAVVSRLENTGLYLVRVKDHSVSSLQRSKQAIASQGEIVADVVMAMEQLVASQVDISQSSSQMAQGSGESQRIMQTGQQSINRLMDSISNLSSELENIKAQVHATAERSVNIGTVLDVITAVAEQTNLLALNAAIEAARAGDAGRGFAVVADEVRKLAQRTNESAAEIQTIIADLQTDTTESAQAIELGVERSQQTIEIASEVDQELGQVVEQVRRISQLALAIDGSIQTQSALSEQTRQRMRELSQSAERAIVAGDEVATDSDKLDWHINNLNVLAKHFLSVTVRNSQKL